MRPLSLIGPRELGIKMREPLVLLPDMMCDARLYQHVIAAFSSERTVIVPNFSACTSIEMMSQTVLNLSPPEFALVGSGLGGIVAMDVVRREAKRVSHLGLISCSPLAETPQASADREANIIGAKIGRLDEVIREELQNNMLAASEQKITHQNQLIDMAMSLGSDVYVTQARALQRRMDQQATLRRIRIPTVVICGAEDGLVPMKRQEFMAELLPSSQLAIIPDAGHFPTLESPELTIRTMQTLLSDEYQPIIQSRILENS